jgi:uncharacterized protein
MRRMSNPFCHIELTTDDLSRAKKFYKSVFDWKLNDMKGMPYTMIDVGKGGVGGGMQPRPMPEAPTAWMPYVQVDSVKKSLAKATKGGAKVVLDYMPIGGNGAIGVFIDPNCAALGVWEAPPKAPKKAAKKAGKKAGKKAAKKAAKKKG